MHSKTRKTAHAAILAALYFTLTHIQNFLLPNSASWPIQCRLSEALCVFALFTPAATAGLTIGCLLFNLSSAASLPLDFLVGSLATILACLGMRLTRHITVGGYPVAAMTMPALTNAVLVGWELTVYLGDTGFTAAAFAINALCVAIGELAVLFIPGAIVYRAVRKRHLDQKFFD